MAAARCSTPVACSIRSWATSFSRIDALRRALIFLALIGFSLAGVAHAEAPPAPQKETPAEAQLNSAGCMSCHTTTDSLSMHTSPVVNLGCADCHGGNAAAVLPPGTPAGSPEYRRVLDSAQV